MVTKTKSQRRSDEEWLQIISECRQSGLAYKAWCKQHDISQSTFYSAVSRLRKKACAVPESFGTVQQTLDLTSHQDVVQINLCEKHCFSHGNEEAQSQSAAHPDNPYMIELTTGSISFKISNGADMSLLDQLLRLTGVIPC